MLSEKRTGQFCGDPLQSDSGQEITALIELISLKHFYTY